MEHRRIALLLALALAACANAEPDQIRREWTYAMDAEAECVDPIEEQLAALDVAAELWGSVGVTVAPGTEPAHFALCFMPHEPRPGRPGLTYQHGDSGLIEVGPIPPCGLAPVVLAHEIGHLVLPGDGHLPDGQQGIMSAVIDCNTRAQWSDSDMAYFAAVGLFP